MTLESLLEAHFAGRPVAVPPELAEQFARALAAHEALGQAATRPASRAEDPETRPQLPEDYEVIREIGRGGMGIVYLVRQKSLGRSVAVKLLRDRGGAASNHGRRFLEEARHLARLRHPNIVAIHEIGTAGEEPFFSMDYIEGQSLAELLRAGPLRPTRALSILSDVCAAIEHAHRQGIIHRDLKPANVLLDSTGTAFVTDFGLARDMHRETHLTASGQAMGTPGYMAPEQARGQTEKIGERTDVHALGAILYECLCGAAPYGNDTAAEVLVRLLSQDALPLRQRDRRIPKDLETICAKALEKDPAARYATVRAFHEELGRFESGQPIVATPASPAARIAKSLRRHWKPVVGLVAVLLLLLLAPVLFDRSQAELVELGRAQASEGEMPGALASWRRAAKLTGTGQRDAFVRLMQEQIASSDDATLRAELGVLAARVDPEVDLGELEHLVARALLARVRASHSSHFDSNSYLSNLQLAQDDQELGLEYVDLVALTRRRMELLAQRTSDESIRAEAESAAIRLSPPKPGSDVVHLAIPEFNISPPPTDDDLGREVADESKTYMTRASAAMRLADRHADAGDRVSACRAWRQAYELISAEFPFVSGVATGFGGFMNSRKKWPEHPYCKNVRAILAELERCGVEPRPETGQLRLLLDGPQLPEGLTFQVGLYLRRIGPSVPPGRWEFDPRVAAEWYSHEIEWEVQIEVDRTTTNECLVLQGTYELSSFAANESAAPGAEEFMRLLEFEPEPASMTLEVGSGVTEIPIHYWTCREISLLEPKEGRSIDLARQDFRWTPIEGVDHYEVFMAWEREGEGRGLGRYTTSGSQVNFGSVSGRETPAHRFEVGDTGLWTVEGFDARGRLIAKSVDRSSGGLVGQRFFVAAIPASR